MAKGQMFVITMVFLAGLIFSVQQLLFQYYALDLSAPFRENEIYMLYNIRDMINSSIKDTGDCIMFNGKMEEMRNFLNSRPPRAGFISTVSYRMDCSYWENVPPQSPPLNVSVTITGKGSETYTTLLMYHK